MKQYYLICDERGHYSFQETSPINRKFIVLIIALSDQQKIGFETLLKEKNSSFELLELASKMRHNQQIYNNLVNHHETQLKGSLSTLDTNNHSDLVQLLEIEVNKATQKIELSKIASGFEKEFDTSLANYERSFGKVWQNSEDVSLF